MKSFQELPMCACGCVSFFVWSAVWGNIITGDNLRGRGFSIVDWCCMCWWSGEDVYHLLIHCEGAYWLWSLAFWSFGVSCVLPKRVIDFLFFFWGGGGWGIGWGNVHWMFGIWYHIVWCGLFGVSAIIVPLRSWIVQGINS